MDTSQEYFSRAVYYVTSPTDDTVLVAIQPKIIGQKWIHWFDTTSERRMAIMEVALPDVGFFSFRRPDHEGAHRYVLTPMTLDIYNHIKEQLVNAQDFTDQQTMIHAFLDSRANEW